MKVASQAFTWKISICSAKINHVPRCSLCGELTTHLQCGPLIEVLHRSCSWLYRKSSTLPAQASCTGSKVGAEEFTRARDSTRYVQQQTFSKYPHLPYPYCAHRLQYWGCKPARSSTFTRKIRLPMFSHLKNTLYMFTLLGRPPTLSAQLSNVHRDASLTTKYSSPSMCINQTSRNKFHHWFKKKKKNSTKPLLHTQAYQERPQVLLFRYLRTSARQNCHSQTLLRQASRNWLEKFVSTRVRLHQFFLTSLANLTGTQWYKCVVCLMCVCLDETFSHRANRKLKIELTCADCGVPVPFTVGLAFPAWWAAQWISSIAPKSCYTLINKAARLCSEAIRWTVQACTGHNCTER